MANDVVLEDNDNPNILRIEAPTIRIAGSDLMLEAPSRMTPGSPSPYRRALVHDERDGLTVNFNKDYPGGVTLNGVTEITPHQDRGKIIPGIPRIVVHGDITFEVQSLKLDTDKQEIVMIPVSLAGELDKLQTQISELAAKVKALGG